MFSFPAEDIESRSIAWPMVVLISAPGIVCFFAANLLGILIGFFLLALGIFVASRIAKNVSFYETEIKINYFLFKKVVILSYSDIRVVCRTTEQETRARIFVAELKPNAKLKKFTWHCNDWQFEEMKSLLKSHSVLWTKKE